MTDTPLTRAQAVADLAARLGLPLEPWQLDAVIDQYREAEQSMREPTIIAGFETFFFTFGFGGQLRHRYVRIDAHDIDCATKIMNDHFGDHWSRSYSHRDFRASSSSDALEMLVRFRCDAPLDHCQRIRGVVRPNPGIHSLPAMHPRSRACDTCRLENPQQYAAFPTTCPHRSAEE